MAKELPTPTREPTIKEWQAMQEISSELAKYAPEITEQQRHIIRNIALCAIMRMQITSPVRSAR